MLRLFTGVSIASHVLQKLEETVTELHPLAAIAWSPMENLHITCKFIGPWPAERLPELKEALGNLDPPPAFTITIAGFGCYPNPRSPRVLFAAVQADSELAELARAIDRALAPLGIPAEDRPYSPHLTLARIKPKTPRENVRQLNEKIATMTNLNFGTFQAIHFHLYLSKAGARGSVYTILASYPLRAVSGSEA